MRIVFLCEQYPPVVWDGVGNYTRDIAGALADLGHEVHVLCAQGTRIRDEADGDVLIHRRPLLRVPVSRLLGRYGRLLAGADYPRDSISLRISLAVSYALWLRRLDLRPDVIETQDGHLRTLLTGARHDTPVVIHLHCPPMLVHRMHDRLSRKGELVDRLDLLSARQADGLTAPSDLLVETLRAYNWLPAGREVDVIPLPFDPAPFATVPPADQTGPTGLVVGRLEWLKGVDVMLNAAANLRVTASISTSCSRACPRARSRVWRPERGSNDGPASPGRPARLVGHVAFSELLDLYAEARVVVVPSRFENFSVAGLEGMAPRVRLSPPRPTEWPT